jgi:hypothetical protein
MIYLGVGEMDNACWIAINCRLVKPRDLNPCYLMQNALVPKEEAMKQEAI